MPVISILAYMGESGDISIATWWEEIDEDEAIRRVMVEDEYAGTTKQFRNEFNLDFDVRKTEPAKLRIEDGIITSDDTPFDGLSLRPLLRAYRESAMDWPEAIASIGIDHLFEDPENMHPGEDELAVLRQFSPDEEWERDDLYFDT